MVKTLPYFMIERPLLFCPTKIQQKNKGVKTKKTLKIKEKLMRKIKEMLLDLCSKVTFLNLFYCEECKGAM